MWYWIPDGWWHLISAIHCAQLNVQSRKPVPSKAPVKFHESHRRVMRSVNRNR